jgi:hypothetical protein
VREQIEKLIERKREENAETDRQIAELQLHKRENSAFISGLQESLRLLPKDAEAVPTVRVLRPGSEVAKAREAIAKAGGPLHIREILSAIGKSADRKSRASLSGSISAYYRNGEIFTRPQPNVFGLIEMATAPGSGDEAKEDEENEGQGHAHLNGQS